MTQSHYYALLILLCGVRIAPRWAVAIAALVFMVLSFRAGGTA